MAFLVGLTAQRIPDHIRLNSGFTVHCSTISFVHTGAPTIGVSRALGGSLPGGEPGRQRPFQGLVARARPLHRPGQASFARAAQPSTPATKGGWDNDYPGPVDN